MHSSTLAVADSRLGERIAVALVAKDGCAPELEDVTEWLAERDVAIYKRPEMLVLVESLPRNPMNKVMRNELRETVIGQLPG